MLLGSSWRRTSPIISGCWAIGGNDAIVIFGFCLASGGVLAGLATSTGEATRKLAENAVSLNGEKISRRTYGKGVMGESPTLRLGKKSVRVEWVD